MHGNDDWWCGGGVQIFCSLALIFARLFLSAFYLVILADAGTHGTASVVGRYYYCIVVVLLFVAVSAFSNVASGACG
ncbi:hypothetical protein HQK29_24025 [Vibrio vulnificus]|nr:hypothetical protein [Vibrio vulnificus]